MCVFGDGSASSGRWADGEEKVNQSVIFWR